MICSHPACLVCTPWARAEWGFDPYPIRVAPSRWGRPTLAETMQRRKP